MLLAKNFQSCRVMLVDKYNKRQLKERYTMQQKVEKLGRILMFLLLLVEVSLISIA